MGEDYIKKYNFNYEIIGEIKNDTSSNDTKDIINQMIKNNIELLIFVGGDGTARDVLDVVKKDIPVIAVPSGVKMFSSVFALSAHAAAEMINTFSKKFIEKEVLDIDEEAFRNNKLAAKSYGYVKVPDIKNVLQGKKKASNVKGSAANSKKEVAKYIVEKMKDNFLYILGPGTTVKAITDEMNVGKVLLGIDAVYNKKLVGSDLNENEILKLIKTYKNVKIIITPIGGNGFIFGRGSKQITPNILKLVKKENIILVSTIDKVDTLECLRVDTGDYEVDKELSGFIDVIIGYNEGITMKIKY